MRRALRTRSKKRIRVRTPGGKTAIHFKKEKPGYLKCGVCGKKIVRKRLEPVKFKKLPKVFRRPERPFPELCSACMREKIKGRVR